MSQKYITLTFVFEEEIDEEDWVSLELAGIERDTNLSDAQIDALGERIGQSDTWQVDRWIDIQRVLGNSKIKFVDVNDD